MFHVRCPKEPHLCYFKVHFCAFVLSLTQKKPPVIWSHGSRCSSWNICWPRITQWQAAAKWGWTQCNQRVVPWGIQAEITQTLSPLNVTGVTGLNAGFGLSWKPPRSPHINNIAAAADTVVPCCEGGLMGKHQTSREGWCVARRYLLMGLAGQRHYSGLLNLSQSQQSSHDAHSTPAAAAAELLMILLHWTTPVAVLELYHSLPVLEEQINHCLMQ